MRLWGVSDINPSESLQTLKAETLETLESGSKNFSLGDYPEG